MLLWNVISPQFGIKTIDYPMAMLINITLWIAIGPLALAGRWGHGHYRHWRHEDHE
jgi:hypothetical protein